MNVKELVEERKNENRKNNIFEGFGNSNAQVAIWQWRERDGFFYLQTPPTLLLSLTVAIQNLANHASSLLHLCTNIFFSHKFICFHN